ncbi:MAG TPA: DUF885 family protein [Puia sp.]|nr:DUF885 family protein [Puia sp.]
MTLRFRCLVIPLLIAWAGPGEAQVSPDPYVPCQEMPTLISDYHADSRAIVRFYTSSFYGTRFRGYSLEGTSPETRARMGILDRQYLDKLNKVDFNGLPQECKADYILFSRDLKEDLRLLAVDSERYQKIRTWFPFADSIYALEKRRRRGHQLDAPNVAREWSREAAEVNLLRARLKTDSSLDLDLLYEAGLVVSDLRRAIGSIYEFYQGYDPLFTWWVPVNYRLLNDALSGYGDELKAKRTRFVANDKSGIVGRPVGRAELIRQLQYEMIPYTPEELIAIANKEFAWCDKEMLKASREMGFGDNWKAALEKVKNSYVTPGQQPGMILGLYNESVDFIKKHDLVTIPPLAEETWGMVMMTPERQRVNPFFTGGDEISISYPTDSMSEEDRMMSMRGNNPHFSRATVHHELIAGHNLQAFMNQRYRTYRDFGSGFWTEGWSLYWELLLWDLKFPQTPEDKMGMLFWHMHRCARIIFSLNYHLGNWTPEQCIDFLVDRVGHERANAEGEVRRSFATDYPPLYQLAYLTGGRQFYALKTELVDRGKMTYRQFHDTILKLNAMPVEMIRAILEAQPLDKDYRAHWRFYDGMKLPGD